MFGTCGRVEGGVLWTVSGRRCDLRLWCWGGLTVCPTFSYILVNNNLDDQTATTLQTTTPSPPPPSPVHKTVADQPTRSIKLSIMEDITITTNDIDNDAVNNDTTRFWTSVVPTAELPTLQACHDFCVDPSCGAVATFVGTTRNTFQGKVVTRLSYEAYTPMATKELQKLCRAATARYKTICKIAIHHVVGDCNVTQASVHIACSSPHRRESLQCVEYLIDTLKATVPIWKREHYEGDDSVWKENIEWKQGRPLRIMVRQEDEEKQQEEKEEVTKN